MPAHTDTHRSRAKAAAAAQKHARQLAGGKRVSLSRYRLACNAKAAATAIISLPVAMVAKILSTFGWEGTASKSWGSYAACDTSLLRRALPNVEATTSLPMS
jgi:hypothetical protein